MGAASKGLQRDGGFVLDYIVQLAKIHFMNIFKLTLLQF